jgi:hypothetical protein
MVKIKITAGDIVLEAELNDSPTAEKIRAALPLAGEACTWGDEVYFQIPVRAEQAPDARDEVEAGELGYWPMGHAFCVFFGPTPLSSGDQPVAASPVNIVGRVRDDATKFRGVKDGMAVKIEAA